MGAREQDVTKLINDINSLGGGYSTDFGTSNSSKPNQQLHVYKNNATKPIAKVSLMLSCRVSTLFNGVGKNEKELLDLLVEFSKKV